MRVEDGSDITRASVYTFARVVVDGEPATQAFPAGESVILPAWTTAAMLVSLLPDGASTWQDHPQTRREVRPTSE